MPQNSTGQTNQNTKRFQSRNSLKPIITLKEIKEEKNIENKQKNNKKKIYSYEHDADLIYTAFLDQYKLDLNDIEYLHWFKFKAMFEGLKSENKICEIMGYRAVDISKIKDKEEKKRYKKLQREYALPDDRTEEEKERDFADALWQKEVDFMELLKSKNITFGEE